MAKDQKTKKSKMHIWIMLLSFIMIVAMQMTFILVVVGLLPSIISRMVDQSDGKRVFHTIFACNLSGVLPFVAQLLASENDSSAMYMMIKDMQVLFIMWFSAAIGYALVHIAPALARLIIISINDQKMTRLKDTQEKLLQEWGRGIAILDEEEAMRHTMQQQRR